MNKNTLIIVVVVILIAAGGFLYWKKMKSSETAMAPVSQSMKPAGEKVDVPIKGFAFNPADLTIKVGQTVTWTNQDSVSHNVVSDDGSFKSETLASGQSFSHTFDKAGIFSYACTFHPNMKAKVTVQ